MTNPKPTRERLAVQLERELRGCPDYEYEVQSRVEIVLAALRAAVEAEREACAAVCDDQGQLYRDNAKVCDETGNHHGATSDLHAALACEGCTAAIRKRATNDT